MRSKSLLLSLILVVVGFAGTAEAATITLTPAQIAAFTLGATSGNVTAGINSGGAFNVQFGGGAGPGFAEFDLTGLSISYTAGDIFSLLFVNQNLSLWTFDLEVTTDAGLFTFSSAIAPGFGTSMDVVLAAGSTITDVRIRVSGTIPNTSNPTGTPDVAADWQVSPVPEPGSLLLMGSGLLLLSASRFFRKRF